MQHKSSTTSGASVIDSDKDASEKGVLCEYIMEMFVFNFGTNVEGVFRFLWFLLVATSLQKIHQAKSCSENVA